MLCYFLLYGRVNQLHIYTVPLFFFLLLSVFELSHCLLSDFLALLSPAVQQIPFIHIFHFKISRWFLLPGEILTDPTLQATALLWGEDQESGVLGERGEDGTRDL